METTWQDPELRFLLGEMIKASSVDVSLVAEFIKAHNIEQNWMNMQLPIVSLTPAGRTMQQCMVAAERVLAVHQPQPPNFYSLKRKSLETSDQPLKRQATMAPIESAHPPRNIQPRPNSNGYAPAPSINSSSSVPSTGTGTGKKRGRPSKADKEAQARANSFRTMEYAPITPAPAPAPAPLAPISMAPQREYVSSPGYEVAGNTPEIKTVKRSKLSGNENSPTVGYYPLASPASLTDPSRGGTEPTEQPGLAQSPRDQGTGQPKDLRSSSFHPPPKHHSPSPAQSQPQSNTLPPIQPGPRLPPEQYRPERPRAVDPIFPDRDRTRTGFDPISRSTPPTPPVANRG
ncbi:hypothetical protein SUNI508_09778 [Seiridium unicorne]|uniref:Uncharacterized protein n=1 Tax=Seiridium unicorne TaxID=138068 RepID=A0ABR2UNJ3_9PEZI